MEIIGIAGTAPFSTQLGKNGAINRVIPFGNISIVSPNQFMVVVSKWLDKCGVFALTFYTRKIIYRCLRYYLLFYLAFLPPSCNAK